MEANDHHRRGGCGEEVWKFLTFPHPQTVLLSYNSHNIKFTILSVQFHGFSVFTELCNHHYILNFEHFHWNSKKQTYKNHFSESNFSINDHMYKSEVWQKLFSVHKETKLISIPFHCSSTDLLDNRI